jgi:hypothetical protein
LPILHLQYLGRNCLVINSPSFDRLRLYGLCHPEPYRHQQDAHSNEDYNPLEYELQPILSTYGLGWHRKPLRRPCHCYLRHLNSRYVFPWISWEDTHSNFDRVGQFPATIWRALGSPGIELARWLYVVCATLFFCFFGIAEEVRTFYGTAFRYAFHLIGIRRNRSDANVFKPDSRLKTSHPGDTTLSGNFDADSVSTRMVVGDAEMGGGEWSTSIKGSFSQ